MKKILACMAAAAVISVPVASSALEPMKKDELKQATAQAGVRIFFDHIVIAITSQPTVTYWDTDGVTSYGGTVGNIQSAGIRIEYASKKNYGPKK